MCSERDSCGDEVQVIVIAKKWNCAIFISEYVFKPLPKEIEFLIWRNLKSIMISYYLMSRLKVKLFLVLFYWCIVDK